MKIKNLFIAFICGIFLAACSQSANTPEEVAIKFSECLYKGDAKGVLVLLDLEEVKKEAGAMQMAEGKLAATAERAKMEADSKGGIKEITIAEKDIQDDRADIYSNIVFNDGSTTPSGNIALIKKNGKWLVRLK